MSPANYNGALYFTLSILSYLIFWRLCKNNQTSIQLSVKADLIGLTLPGSVFHLGYYLIEEHTHFLLNQLLAL